MKKNKIKLGFILAVIGFILFLPLSVKAKTVEELNAILDSIVAEDEVNLKAISPANISDTTYRNSYIEGLEYYYYDDNNFPYLIKFKDDYSVFYLESCDRGSCIQSKTKNINWATGNQDKINEVLTFVKNNKNKRLMDIEYLDYYYKSYSDDSSIKYLESKNTNPHITVKIKRIGIGGMGSDQYTDYNLYSPYPIYFYNDDIVYFTTTGYQEAGNSLMDLTTYPILFIPSNTIENINSYVSVALNKIKAYYPNVKVDVKNYTLEDYLKDVEEKFKSDGEELTDEELQIIKEGYIIYNSSRLQFGYNNGLIDRNLNSTFEPLVVKVTIGSMSHEMIVAKANDNKITEYVPDDLKYLNSNYISSINGNTNSTPDDKNNNDSKENLQTGVFIHYSLLILGIGVGLYLINICKKKALFRKI